MIQINHQSDYLTINCSGELQLNKLNEYTTILKETINSFSGNQLKIVIHQNSKIDYSFLQFIIVLKAHCKLLNIKYELHSVLDNEDKVLLINTNLYQQII